MSAKWTTENMPILTGKVIIVTGGNSGVGFEAAKEFARKGAQTILACRSINKAEAALNRIRSEIPDAQAEVMLLDLSRQASVHQFASTFKQKYDTLDVLVNNAGIMMVPYSTTEDGFENHFATNHLGHFALTGLLLDLLLATAGSRVVTVSSNGHRIGDMDFDNLMYAQGENYSSGGAYCRSKLANLLFTYELQRRFEAVKASAIAVAAHPGVSSTNLASHAWYVRLIKPLLRLTLQSPAMGALPTLRAAADPHVKGGEYYGPDGGTQGYPVLVRSSAASHDETDARKLWAVSAQLTGVRYSQLD